MVGIHYKKAMENFPYRIIIIEQGYTGKVKAQQRAPFGASALACSCQPEL
jgi:hypothetical protein